VAWWQLTVQCTQSELEPTEHILLELGALSITLADAHDEPIYEPLPGENPVWQVSMVTGLFDQQQSLEDLYDDLVKRLPAHQVATIRKQQLDDQVWERAYLDQFKPTCFGDMLWICPSWHEPPQPDACNIILDPGIAFGTGSHPTTALCLQYLDQHPPVGKCVVDYGCGSGILAIAAYKLGAKKVSSIDIDPQALDATAENARRNGIDPNELHIGKPGEADIKSTDYLIANILSGPLIELEPKFASIVKPGGQLLLSGILTEQADEMRRHYQRHFNIDAVKIEQDWCRVTGIRNHLR
jgi:ribosomal protein L11 methyltransferase